MVAWRYGIFLSVTGQLDISLIRCDQWREIPHLCVATYYSLYIFPNLNGTNNLNNEQSLALNVCDIRVKVVALL